MKHFTQTLFLLSLFFCLFSFSALACEKCTDEELSYDSLEFISSHSDEEKELGYFLDYDVSILEKLVSTPKEILSGSTKELLDYFLESDLLIFDSYSRSDLATKDTLFDYSVHPAFSELIKRTDVLPEIINKAALISTKNTSSIEQVVFMQFLNQHEIKKIFDQNPTFKKQLEEMFVAQKIHGYKGPNTPVYHQDGVDYYYAGSVYSSSGNAVSALTAGRELTNWEINRLNNSHDLFGNRIFTATAKFNCYSYSWYRNKTWNPYWITAYYPFMADAECQSVPYENAQINDIIVYKVNGVIVHAGVVHSKVNGQLTIRSKFGQAGLYTHAVGSVPPIYRNPDNTVNVFIYRYHDYGLAYTGNNYHSGNRHYHQYAQTCAVCSHQKADYVWQSVYCNGSPCITPNKFIDSVDR